MSPNAMAVADAGIKEVHRRIDDTSIEELARGLHPPSAVTPRAAGQIVRAGILRQGLQIANGFNEIELMSEDTRRAILHESDVELTFERVRREVAPNAVSRLSCLYLAERSADGEAMLRKMLGEKVYILKVRLSFSLRLTRVDSAWFDGFFDPTTSTLDDIRMYWQGAEKPGGARWEYLFDGELEIDNQAQIDHVRKYGARI